MDAVETTTGARLTLAPTAPYDFALAYLRSSPSAVLERVRVDGVRADGVVGDIYERAVRLAGRPVLLRLWSVGTLEAPQLALEVRGATGLPALSPELVVLAERQIRRTFLLDADPAGFAALASADPVFGRLLARFPALRPILIAEPYEALLWAILGQQVNVAFARKLKLALVGLCGESLEVDGADYPLLPEAARVARLTPEALRAAQFSRQKAAYTLAVSRAIAEGALRLDELGALPHDEALARLTAHKGIGRWTAEYVLMRGYGARDSIPAADLGLRAILGRAYGLGRTATEGEVRALAERWAGWRGWAAYAWWLALQLKMAI